MPAIKLYNFGQFGVNVDASDLHMQEGQLRRAQNMVNNTLGFGGGIMNRPGLTRFNASALAGPVLGGIGVPLPDGLLPPVLTSSTSLVYLSYFTEA